jgi:hypothetical protein
MGDFKAFPGKKAKAWYKICETFSTKFQSDPRNFLIKYNYHAPTIFYELKRKTGGVPDYPLLRGPKIAPMFLRFLRDWAHVKLKDCGA